MQLGDDGAEAGPAAERGQVVDLPAGHALKRVVPIGRADDGANDRAAVHDAGELGKDFANLKAGNLGGDRRELAADFVWRVELEIEHVLMRRAAAQEDVDDRFVPLALAGSRFEAIQIGEREGRRTDAEAADPEEAAAGDAVAIAAALSVDGEHGAGSVGGRAEQFMSVDGGVSMKFRVVVCHWSFVGARRVGEPASGISCA